jgi:hypothetical protein
MNFHFTNPGGNELTAGLIPLTTVTKVVAGCWGAMMLFVATLMVYAKTRERPPAYSQADMQHLDAAVASPVRTLHIALLAVSVLLFISALFFNE